MKKRLLMDMTAKDEIEQEMYFLNLEIQSIEERIKELSKDYEKHQGFLTVLDWQATKRTLAYLDLKMQLDKIIDPIQPHINGKDKYEQ